MVCVCVYTHIYMCIPHISRQIINIKLYGCLHAYVCMCVCIVGLH